MGIFDKIKGVFSGKKPENEKDYLQMAKEFEGAGNFVEAIKAYNQLIETIYTGKEYYKYKHITKKIVELYIKLGDFERVAELWSKQYSSEEYGLREKYQLAIFLEKAGKPDMALKIYNAEDFLQKQKVEFLLRQKKIDEANKECTRLIMMHKSSDEGIADLWFLKAKILMSLKRLEEAENYLLKVIEKRPNDLEAKKLKTFCTRYTRA
jgi:tetratricopeptide (TPR) repeat protein